MKLQEEAITLFQRAGQPVYADNARQRARHARERLELALQEQREQQALMGARKAQPFSS
jgi:hypothetical protein